MNLIILILLVTGIIAIFALFIAFFWIGGLLLPILYKGGPYVPSSRKKTTEMITLANLQSSDHVLDLGSGDGRLLIAAIKAGAHSGEGYEIHPGLIWLSRLYARIHHMNRHIIFHQKSFWDADVSKANVVLLYQLPKPMERLEKKLREELPHGARVISHSFPMTNWQPEQVVNKIFVYKKP